LLAAVDRGYRTTISERVRPWAFLYLRMPPGTVDMNVHPAKAEVRFRDAAAVESCVEEAVRAGLTSDSSAATLDTQLTAPQLLVREPCPPSADGKSEVESQTALFLSPHRQGPEGDVVVEPIPVVEERPRLWQVLNTYVLAETHEGLIIIDQHSAHERILFERLSRAFEESGQTAQRLLFPLTIRLSKAEYEQVEALTGILNRVGFAVEGFGGNTIIVHAVPDPHPYFDPERCLREMIGDLVAGSDLTRSAKNQHERIAMTFACKGAIKAGQGLSESEMQELFDQLFATELPYHDVHGRPTIVRLSKSELERKFGR
jgi:DNA mismatch repair protein MutL